MTSLYMFPPLFKSRGLKSPSFLEWSKKKRKKRQALKKLFGCNLEKGSFAQNQQRSLLETLFAGHS